MDIRSITVKNIDFDLLKRQLETLEQVTYWCEGSMFSIDARQIDNLSGLITMLAGWIDFYNALVEKEIEPCR